MKPIIIGLWLMALLLIVANITLIIISKHMHSISNAFNFTQQEQYQLINAND